MTDIDIPDEIKELGELLKHLGECIFPQKIEDLHEKFGEEVLIRAANMRMIQRAEAKGGANPSAMRKVPGYIELTSAGWEKYNEIFKSGNPQS